MPRLLDLFCGAGGAAVGYHRAGFDVVHASPPCQGYTPMTNRWGSEAPLLIEPVRERLQDAGLPYVIENVVGAPLKNPARLCGSYFGLTAHRHRLFESNVLILSTPCSHRGPGTAVYGRADGRRLATRVDGSELRAWSSLDEGKAALGIDWDIDENGVREAIPPAYTEWIGQQLLDTPHL